MSYFGVSLSHSELLSCGNFRYVLVTHALSVPFVLLRVQFCNVWLCFGYSWLSLGYSGLSSAYAGLPSTLGCVWVTQ